MLILPNSIFILSNLFLSTFAMGLDDEDTPIRYNFSSVYAFGDKIPVDPHMKNIYGDICKGIINKVEILSLSYWFIEDILHLDDFLNICDIKTMAEFNENRHEHIHTFSGCILSCISNTSLNKEFYNTKYLSFLQHLAKQLYYPIWRLSLGGMSTIGTVSQIDKNSVFSNFFDKSFIIDRENAINGFPVVTVDELKFLKFMVEVGKVVDKEKLSKWIEAYSAFNQKRRLAVNESKIPEGIISKVKKMMFK